MIPSSEEGNLQHDEVWHVFQGCVCTDGNGNVERNYRIVNAVAARKPGSIADATHLYNTTPRKGQ